MKDLSPDEKLTEKVYRRAKYWVQTIEDRVGVVRLYTVTSCDDSFRPEFHTPAGEAVTLNESTFSTELFPSYPRYMKTNHDAQFMEVAIGGAPGQFRSWLIGINITCGWRSKPSFSEGDFPFEAFPLLSPTGPEGFARGNVRYFTDDWHETDDQQWKSDPMIAKFRASVAVNTYAETDFLVEPDALVAEMNGRTPEDPGIYRIGPDAERTYRFSDRSQEPKPYESLPS